MRCLSQMLGTLVSVCSVSALAVGPGQLGPVALHAFAQALSSALLMNVCIVGINQARGRGMCCYRGAGACSSSSAAAQPTVRICPLPSVLVLAAHVQQTGRWLLAAA